MYTPYMTVYLVIPCLNYRVRTYAPYIYGSGQPYIYCRQSRIQPYTAVYDRIFGDSLLELPCTHVRTVYIWFWPTIHVCDTVCVCCVYVMCLCTVCMLCVCNVFMYCVYAPLVR